MFHSLDLPVFLQLFTSGDVDLFTPGNRESGLPVAPSQENTSRRRLAILRDDAETSAVSTWADFILHLHGSSRSLNGYTATTFCCVNNPDGSIRWMYPEGTRHPNFLRLYNSGSLKAQAYRAIVRGAFFLGQGKRVADRRITIYARHETHLERILSALSVDGYSIFTGTVGENRKCVVEVHRSGRTTHFVKIPLNRNSAQLLENENRTLAYLGRAGFRYLQIPQSACHSSGAIFLSDVKPARVKRSRRFSSLHAKALCELYQRYLTVDQLGESDFFERVMQNLYLLRQRSSRLQQRGMQPLFRKLEQLFRSIDPAQRVHLAASHGDFTPWNTFVSEERVHAYDWELSRRDAPLLSDLFHYVIQGEVMQHRSGYGTIREELERALSLPEVADLCQKFRIDPMLHYRLYLLSNVSYYLNLYVTQEQLHPQARWVMDAWEQAITELLPADVARSRREEFLEQFFVRYKQAPYAALKFIHGSVEAMGPFTDLDLVVTPEFRDTVIEDARRHPSVFKSRVHRKSFMTTLELYFRDQSYLSIDLLTDFHRKDVAYLDPTRLLRSATPGRSHVRMPDERFGFEYTWLFNLLNGSSLPKRYRTYYQSLTAEERERILSHINSSFGFEAVSLEEFYDYSAYRRQQVVRKLKKSSTNSIVSRWIRSVSYTADTIRSLFERRGMMITLTGVDGAGKSTIIDELKQLLSEKFRRKVVVLRHRPSLLPILSAWKHGKHHAEAIAVARGPRGGSNRGKLSSLARFLYYYSDYLLGQFVVYARYQLRGYTVLYDRYYFDFIVDARRSNISLSEGFTRSLYRLVRKPDLNILLYAPVDDILRRKQELDADTIQELTDGYLRLFDRLSGSSTRSVYLPLENTDKERTLRVIESAIVKAA